MASEKQCAKDMLDDEETMNVAVQMMFDQFDTDGNGYLDQSETEKFVMEFLGGTSDEIPSDLEIQMLTSTLDYNHDGKITLDELKRLIKMVLEEVAKNGMP